MHEFPVDKLGSEKANKKAGDEPSVRNLQIFIVLVLLSGWIGLGLDAVLGLLPGVGPGILVWILAPMGVSFLLRGFGGDGWSDLGLRPNLKGNWGWYGLSLIGYPFCVIVVVVLGVVMGSVDYHEINGANFKLMAVVFSQTFLLQVIQNMVEETGFRGYLAPRAFSLRWNTLWVHVMVGLVWGAWQIPYLRHILAPIVPYAAENMLTLVPRILIGTTAVSLVYGELRLRTNSLWPAVLMQTTSGSIIAALVMNALITVQAGRVFIFMPVTEGLLMSVLFASLGLLLYLIRTKKFIIE